MAYPPNCGSFLYPDYSVLVKIPLEEKKRLPQIFPKIHDWTICKPVEL